MQNDLLLSFLLFFSCLSLSFILSLAQLYEIKVRFSILKYVCIANRSTFSPLKQIRELSNTFDQ